MNMQVLLLQCRRVCCCCAAASVLCSCRNMPLHAQFRSKQNNTAAANMNMQVLLLQQSRCSWLFAVLLPLCFVLAEKCNTAPLTPT
jgi:hypothetical protein